ncbi:30S ribosomal protein S3 [Candidatus Woesearchaeota archaeon]|nr:30S ribosomal protein S3 [Candidatus Woesearchaeota archaeon]
MIEKQILKKKIKEYQILEYIAEVLNRPGYSHTIIQKTPLGEKITIFTSKPGFIVGRKGSNIKELTQVLKEKFGLENPQIEVSEIDNPNLNPHTVAKHIVNTFERFGPSRYKFIGYKLLEDIMKAGAVGAEIVISGRGVPSQRAKSWRFKIGHLKKSGDVSENQIKRAIAVAHLKSGAVGVKVNILTPDIRLPDRITIRDNVAKILAEEVKEEVVEKIKEKPKKEPKKKTEVKKKIEKVEVKENGDNKEK